MFGGIISTTKLSEDATWKPGQATSTLCREDEKHEDAEGDADPVPKGPTGRARVRIWSCCLSKKALKKVKDTKGKWLFSSPSTDLRFVKSSNRFFFFSVVVVVFFGFFLRTFAKCKLTMPFCFLK
ncbi:hypothetical protein Y1Q_0008288 [Alligator mississippiensis]|uniref:Uncharacterized protein n=1 Tax=Alligator mississippiensis TaxID=8496 RepID=A0A151N1Y1_ALLMI|nr:hypothetical protein Y1Q_0008288 [Alligator mississippiensis]